MIRISLVFDHHKRTPKGEEGPVEVRVTVNRKPYYINTGVRVREGRLVGNALRDLEYKDDAGILRRTDDADVLNERLTAVVRLVEKEVNRCLDGQYPIDVADIRHKVWDSASVKTCEDEPTLVNWIRAMSDAADITLNTKLRYHTLCKRLLEYGKITKWGDLAPDNIYGWDVWLRQQEVPLSDGQRERGVMPRKIQPVAVYNYHKLLKAMLNRAVMLGVIENNPYDRMKGAFKREANEKIEYLTEEQMNKLMELTPVPGSQMEMAKDLFVFQMFTGLSYADTQTFDLSQYQKEIVRDEITGEETVRWKHIGERVKTGVPYVSMLLPPVVEVLERNGWKVPKMNNQRYNQMLKAIGMCIGVERLHSHMGRHTFATWMLSNGARIENVSRMLGHTDIKMTQRYAKVLAEDVYDEFDSVAEKLKKR
jgi:integrase